MPRKMKGKVLEILSLLDEVDKACDHTGDFGGDKADAGEIEIEKLSKAIRLLVEQVINGT